MRTYLLDTHCLIWFQENNPQIPSPAMEVIQEPANTILFSQISLYEIAIKQKIGKLPSFNATILEVYHQARKDNFTFLPINNYHIDSYQKVPLHTDHKDPFDRLLIAVDYEENAIVLTADKNFKLYPNLIRVFW